MWKILQAVVLSATAGGVFAKDVFNAIRLAVETPLMIAVGLGITTMLMKVMTLIAFCDRLASRSRRAKRSGRFMDRSERLIHR